MNKQALIVGNGILTSLPELLKDHAPAHRYALLTDSTVEKLYGNALLKNLQNAGLSVELFSFPAGEASKNETTKQKLDHALLQNHYGRDTVILALGGGTVGDLAGFVAATYLRGIPYVQIPTTLLAMADSSIGGKVGVNTEFGKNTVGAFWQPSLIVADVETLKTLPETELKNGWFEVLKIFMAMDAESYAKAKNGIDLSLLKTTMDLKLSLVEKDERENDLRAVLNLGHSVGHALEQLSAYQIPHGFAVGLGMLVETRLAVELGHLDEATWLDLCLDLQKAGLDTKLLQTQRFEDVWEALQNDKKNRNGEVRFVLLKELGHMLSMDGQLTHPITQEHLRSAWIRSTTL